MIFTQFQRRIKIFRSDGTKEFLSSSMQNLLKSHGTLHQQSCPHTHQQNGTAERKHRHLLDVTRALLLSAYVPKTFWAEAVLTATLLINVTPSSAIGNVTPYSRMHTSPFDYSLLRTFGCTCFVLLPTHEKDKLSAKTSRCIFVGYSPAHKGYRCYDPVTRRLRIAKHVSFFENVPYYKQTSPSPNLSFLESSSSLPIPSYAPPSEIPTHIQPDPQTVATPPSPSISVQDSHATTPCSDTTAPSSPSGPAPPPPRRNPPRDRHPPARYSASATSTYSSDFSCFVASIHSLQEPKSYSEAARSPEWQKAMAEELEAFQKTHTWDLVPLPPGAHPVSCKWIYKVKTKADGSVDRYKARLVARGFTQEYGIDYEETFAPVAKMTSIRTIIDSAAALKWPLYQMDVKNAFLNDDLLRSSTCSRHQGFPLQKVMSVDSVVFSMDSNKHLMLGLSDFVSHCSPLA